MLIEIISGVFPVAGWSSFVSDKSLPSLVIEFGKEVCVDFDSIFLREEVLIITREFAMATYGRVV